MWRHETHTDIAAAPAAVWALFTDVAGWPRWNAGAARAALHGAFVNGSTFEMQLPHGGPLLTSRLLDVRPGESFTDETDFDGHRVRVTHHIAAQGAGHVRVRYRTEVEGPRAAEVGAGVTGDFAQVLATLKKQAEAAP